MKCPCAWKAQQREGRGEASGKESFLKGGPVPVTFPWASGSWPLPVDTLPLPWVIGAEGLGETTASLRVSDRHVPPHQKTYAISPARARHSLVA